MINGIRFSHDYEKLNGEEDAELKYIDVLELSDQTKGFIDYDTQNGTFKLPKSGAYILLLFAGGNGTFFTTLRRFTPSKWRYYREAVGLFFNIHREVGRDE